VSETFETQKLGLVTLGTRGGGARRILSIHSRVGRPYSRSQVCRERSAEGKQDMPTSCSADTALGRAVSATTALHEYGIRFVTPSVVYTRLPKAYILLKVAMSSHGISCSWHKPVADCPIVG
jgi:hypothetical protein